MLYNFKRRGINLNDVNIICSIDERVPLEWVKLRDAYDAKFFFYQDRRRTKKYVSSIRPNILKQHFAEYPELGNETLFYHDCDIIFSHILPTAQFEGNQVWYGSDTGSYTNYDYIISKGQDIFDKMVEMVGIDPQIVIDNNQNSIGAQYILKGVDEAFWHDVQIDSENLFIEINEMNIAKKKENPEYHELQIWCADMWALLWNIWKRGHITKCHDDLRFSWATSSDKSYDEYKIFHNAGVMSAQDDLFFKAKYTNGLPYNLGLELKDGRASKKYYEWIQRVEKESVLL
jgi:hypothetical protein